MHKDEKIFEIIVVVVAAVVILVTVVVKVIVIFLSLFRWVNPASHVLSLHVRDPNPSIWLKKAVEYIMNVYCPSIFNISMEPHVTNGSKHLFDMFKNARTLLKRPTNRGDKICALCLKAFNQTNHLKKHITEVHEGIKTPWELWLKGFFANNWFAHIGKQDVFKK